MKAGISDYTSGLRALVLMLYLRAGYGPAEEAGWCQVPAHVGGDEMGQGELQDLGFSHFLLHPLPHWVLVTFFFFPTPGCNPFTFSFLHLHLVFLIL